MEHLLEIMNRDTQLLRLMQCDLYIFIISLDFIKICGIFSSLGTGNDQPCFQSHVKSMGDFNSLQKCGSNHLKLIQYFSLLKYERAYIFNNLQIVIVENY